MVFTQEMQQKQVLKLTPSFFDGLTVLKKSVPALFTDLVGKASQNPFLSIHYQVAEMDDSWLSNDLVSSENLRAVLEQQVRLERYAPIIQNGLLVIIDQLDGEGYLRVPLEQISDEEDTSLQHLQECLTILQTFDPIGVGARDLAESLLIQARMDPSVPQGVTALLTNGRQLLENQDYGALCQQLAINQTELEVLLDYVKQLNPYPCAAYTTEKTQYITAELLLKIEDNQCTVELFDEGLISLNFDQQAFDQMAATQDTEAQRFLAGQEKQYLNLKRLLNNRYLMWHNQPLELKQLISAPIRSDGESQSTVLWAIQEIVNHEDREHPLSDEKMQYMLEAQSIQISRRTVTKYRQKLKIPAAAKRKE
ncbi:hypothetical protein [Latilactobacillus curvatus]|uniref:RNA polymerase factor sigma-54 n=1 Tax=Latilactobacillus curvatus TaxID=28038 RepID=UPI003EC02D5A